MTTSIVRRCGACLLAGGLLLTVAYIFYPSSARSDSIRPTAAIGLAGVLIILPALIAFQMTQAGRARIAGWLGVTLTVLGIAALEIPHMMFGVFDLTGSMTSTCIILGPSARLPFTAASH